MASAGSRFSAAPWPEELTAPYEEWEVLYRQRLQVERDLLRTGRVPADQGDAEEEPGTVGRLARAVKELIR